VRINRRNTIVLNCRIEAATVSPCFVLQASLPTLTFAQNVTTEAAR